MQLLKKLIVKGFKELIKYKYFSKALIFSVIGLTIIVLSACFIAGQYEALISFIVLISLFSCVFLIIWGYISGIVGLISRIKIGKYQRIFETIGLKSMDGKYPILIQKQKNEYTKVLTFRSKIPLNDWLSKKSVLETYLHANIMKITVDKNDNNIVHVVIKDKKLPDNIPWNDKYLSEDQAVLTLGVSYEKIVDIDLFVNAHAFVAGGTGCGKSTILKSLIYQSIVKGHDVRLIDFKRGVSFSMFRKYITVLSEHEQIQAELKDLVKIANQRFDLFNNYDVEDIIEYNELRNVEPLEHIVVFIDELAELIKTGNTEASNSIINSLETLTRMSRAAGVNLFMGLQRPDATIINGQIKSNVSCRICGRFVDREPSHIMLANDMAMNLPNIKGRFILKDSEFLEFQAFNFKRSSIDMGGIKAKEKGNSGIELPYDSIYDLPSTEDIEFDFEHIEI